MERRQKLNKSFKVKPEREREITVIHTIPFDNGKLTKLLSNIIVEHIFRNLSSGQLGSFYEGKKLNP